MIRIFDVIFSGLAILFLTPMMLPIIIILKFTGEHDIIFSQLRVGKNGTPFKVFKFATMLRDSPNMPGGLITAPNDPRLLPLGNFLRKTKINEIPQLWNIFIGQMSIVGYRPFAVKHYELYSDEVKKTINMIPPGLTGIGSILFRREEEILHAINDREYFHDKVITPYKGKIECWYVKNRTVKNYFKIIFTTALILLNKKSNFWKKLFTDIPQVPPDLKTYIF